MRRTIVSDGWIDDFHRDGFCYFPGLLQGVALAEAEQLFSARWDLATSVDGPKDGGWAVLPEAEAVQRAGVHLRDMFSL